MAAIGRQGRASATSVVGEHQHQESSVPRRPLCRRADRTRHGEHDSARDARSLSRSWPTARQPRRGRRGRARDSRGVGAHGHFAQGSDRHARRRRRDAVQRGLRQPARGRGKGTTRRADDRCSTGSATPSRRISPPRSRTSSPIGRSRARRGGCGRAMRHSGLAATKAAGWAGSASPTTRWRIIGPLNETAQEVANAGVAHAVLLGMGGSSLASGGDAKDLRERQGLSRTASCWTRPTPHRSPRSSTRWTSRTRSSSCRASRARHSNPTSCCSTSSNA